MHPGKCLNLPAACCTQVCQLLVSQPDSLFTCASYAIYVNVPVRELRKERRRGSATTCTAKLPHRGTIPSGCQVVKIHAMRTECCYNSQCWVLCVLKTLMHNPKFAMLKWVYCSAPHIACIITSGNCTADDRCFFILKIYRLQSFCGVRWCGNQFFLGPGECCVPFLFRLFDVLIFLVSAWL